MCVAECFQQRLKGVVQALDSWMTVKLEFLREPDAEPKKGIQGYRAIALTSVMSKWYASCVMMLVERELCVGSMGKASGGRHKQHKLPALASDDDQFAAQTLGVARKTDLTKKTWMCGTADDVSCQLGHQYCL